MKQIIKMRVDFLEDGQMVPLMFVDRNGNVIRIDRIIENIREKENVFKFVCKANGKSITIIFEDYIWYVLY